MTYVWSVNAYVIVTCDTPGVTRIVVVDLNLHIVTKDVPMIFTANGTVTAKDGYELVSPKGGTYKDLPIGDAVSYAVKSTKAGEPGGSGSIILYKLDVEIDGIGEDKEETEGAFVSDKDSGDIHKSVTIRCYPATETADVIKVSYSDAGILIDQTSGSLARESYSPKELETRTFILYGGFISETERDSTISAEHIINTCQDFAKHTVVGLETETTASYEPEPVNRSRRKLGVGEGLTIMIKPGSLSGVWSVNGSYHGGWTEYKLFLPWNSFHAGDINDTYKGKFDVVVFT